MSRNDRSVMVIDDDRLVLQSISALFMCHGFFVNSFDNAIKAIAAFGKLKPSVVLADISSPLMESIYDRGVSEVVSV